MVGVFRQKYSGNIVTLFFLGVLLKLPVFIFPQPALENAQDGFAYKKLIQILEPFATAFPSVYSLLAFILIFFNAITLTRFINNQRLMVSPNYLPGMAYLLLTSLVPEFNVLSSQLVVTVFYLIIFIQIFRSFKPNVAKTDIFNAGLMLGLATTFFTPSLVFLAWLIIALALLRPFKLNEWLLMLLGLLTPYYFAIAILYLKNSDFSILFTQFDFGVNTQSPTLWIAGAVFLILAPLLTGAYYSQSYAGRMLIHVRKAWSLFFIFILVCILAIFFSPTAGYENWVMVLTPIAAFHGFGYYNAELKLYPKIVFWTTVLFIVASQLFSGSW